jgi:hypothetical protein
MLNRTNRTLSANLNRLNLGTRSLAFVACNNIGAKTLLVRHDQEVVMRAGMVGYCDPRIPDSHPDYPSIPGSSFVPSRLVSSRVVRPRVELAVGVTASATSRLVALCDQPEWWPQSQTSRRPWKQERRTKGLKGTTTRATRGTAVARSATTGG